MYLITEKLHRGYPFNCVYACMYVQKLANLTLTALIKIKILLPQPSLPCEVKWGCGGNWGREWWAVLLKDSAALKTVTTVFFFNFLFAFLWIRLFVQGKFNLVCGSRMILTQNNNNTDLISDYSSDINQAVAL